MYCLATARGIRLPYAFLLACLLLTLASSVTEVALLVIDANDFRIDEGSSTTAADIVSFFTYWAIPCLFLSIVHLLRNRQGALRSASNGRLSLAHPCFRAVEWLLVVLMVALGTATAALGAQYNSFLKKLSGPASIGMTGGEIVAALMRKILVVDDVEYSFLAVWYLAIIEAVVLGIFLHRAMRALNIHDKVGATHTGCSEASDMISYMISLQVTSIVVRYVLPLYLLRLICDIIFVVIASPSGLKLVVPRALEAEALATDIIRNVLFTAITSILLSLALGSRYDSSHFSGKSTTRSVFGNPFFLASC